YSATPHEMSQVRGLVLGIEPRCGVRRPTVRATVRARRVADAHMILQSLAGLPAFLVYFCTAIVAVVTYLFVYTRVTPHNEFELIRAKEPASAIALGLSLLGF